MSVLSFSASSRSCLVVCLVCLGSSLSAQTNDAPLVSTNDAPLSSLITNGAPLNAGSHVAEPNPFPSTKSNTNGPPLNGLVTNDAPLTTPPAASDIRPVPDTVREFATKLALVSPIAQYAHDPTALDLAQCFRLTAIRNDQLKISVQDIRIAQARLSQSIANLWPTFAINNQQDFIHYKEPNATGDGGGGQFTQFSTGSTERNYESSTHFTMSYTIFNGGQNLNTIAAGSAAVAADEHNLERNYQTIYQSVAQAFYNILEYEGDLVILQDEAQSLEATVGELKQRVFLGRSRPAELLQAESNLATTRVTIEQIKGSYNASQETMSYYLGLPVQKIKLKETQKLPNAAQLEIYLNHTNMRPDILSDYESLREARRNLDVATGQLLPTVTASGDYLATEDPPTDQIDATMTLEVSLPIFDGGLIINEIKQNKETVRQSELNLEDLQRTADEDTRTAYADFNASVAQVLVLREAALLSAQNFEAQLKDYRRGVVSNLDVLTALQDFHTARQQLHNADMTARADLINLHVAAGLAAMGPNADNRALPKTSLGVTPASLP